VRVSRRFPPHAGYIRQGDARRRLQLPDGLQIFFQGDDAGEFPDLADLGAGTFRGALPADDVIDLDQCQGVQEDRRDVRVLEHHRVEDDARLGSREKLDKQPRIEHDGGTHDLVKTSQHVRSPAVSSS
jgi:hypothetical protein